jgi:histidinol-phosphate aminotransferase
MLTHWLWRFVVNILAMTDPYKYVRANILALQPYSTARDECKSGDISVWLDANESPYNTGLNRYPDPHHKALKKKIAALKGIGEEHIFIGGSGSDEAIDLTFRIFCVPGRDKAIAITPSYGMYAVAAATNDVELISVPLNADFSLPTEALLAAAKEHDHVKLMWVCSPNNPTGNAFAISDLERLADEFDGMLVVDEAYIDFSDKGSMLSVLSRHRNVIVLHTFSKAWGMASLRVGMAFADESVATLYNRVKYPYNINEPTQAELIKRIDIDISRKVAETIEQRQWLSDKLQQISTCVTKVYPSDANFLLVEVTEPDSIYDYLVSHGVIVRNRSHVAGCGKSLRITVGTPTENKRVVSLLEAYGKADTPTDTKTDDRTACIERHTAETSILVRLNLDGEGDSHIDTGLEFFNHMLWQLPHHSGVALTVECRGDLAVDEHHTMEDVAIALGDAIYQALGSKRGIERYGFVLPMDECRAMVLIDLGGRSEFVWDVNFTREYVGDTPTEMYKHFFKSLCTAMHCNLHISAQGENNHHLIEGVFKGFARALRAAIRRDKFSYEIPSSKGVI